jgi:hypothetical protein
MTRATEGRGKRESLYVRSRGEKRCRTSKEIPFLREVIRVQGHKFFELDVLDAEALDQEGEDAGVGFDGVPAGGGHDE